MKPIKVDMSNMKKDLEVRDHLTSCVESGGFVRFINSDGSKFRLLPGFDLEIIWLQDGQAFGYNGTIIDSEDWERKKKENQ